METGDRATGGRQCRTVRRRAAAPPPSLTVRHGDDGFPMLSARRIPGPRRRSRRGPAAVTLAVAAWLGCAVLLVTGAYLRPAETTGPCPARTSAEAFAGGRRLLLRVEPARGPTALLHLCADPAIGPVRAWTVRVGGPATDPVTVQPVSDSVGLAVAPFPAGRRRAVTVTVRPGSGPALTFAARLASPAVV